LLPLQLINSIYNNKSLFTDQYFHLPSIQIHPEHTQLKKLRKKYLEKPFGPLSLQDSEITDDHSYPVQIVKQTADNTIKPIDELSNLDTEISPTVLSVKPKLRQLHTKDKEWRNASTHFRNKTIMTNTSPIEGQEGSDTGGAIKKHNHKSVVLDDRYNQTQSEQNNRDNQEPEGNRRDFIYTDQYLDDELETCSNSAET
jgi:hypothetical protein